MTVGKWLAEWLGRHRARVRSSTHTRYQAALRTWVIPSLGLMQLKALTHKHIEAMHEVAIQAGRSPYTIRQNHAPLRAALQEAERDGLIMRNPAASVHLPRLEKTEVDAFTQGEAQRFLAANEKSPLFPVFHLALQSGLRLGELLALRVVRDIDLDSRTITVREARRHDVTGAPKSKSSTRRLKLSLRATKVLANAIAEKPDGALAFHWKTDLLSRSMDQACALAGVKRIRFHDLRHTHATLLLASGANIKAVSARLGHASVAFTLDVYGHVMPGMDEALADKAGDIFEQNCYQNAIIENGLDAL